MVTCVVETEEGSDRFESEGICVITSDETGLVTLTDEHDTILEVYEISDLLEVRLSYLEA